MTRQICYVATAQDVSLRLDVLLAMRKIYPSRSAAVRAIGAGHVFVNGKPANKKLLINENDAIVCEIDEENIEGNVLGEPIELDIRYEDDDVIVLSKQAGLVCHPSIDHANHTLVNALVYHCGSDHLCDVQGEHDRLGIVHRLDRDTSGLMLAAKNNEAGNLLMEEIKDRTVNRRYIALVHGIITHDTGMIDAPIARSATQPKQMAVRDCASARNAVTTFRVLERFEESRYDDGYTLVECKLFTGRTHQIRVHMLYTNHPVVGDPVYNATAPKDPRSQLGLTRQFLHSYFLEFIHPISNTELTFCDNLPSDLSDALCGLEPRSCGRTETGKEVFDAMALAPTPIIETEFFDEPSSEV